MCQCPAHADGTASLSIRVGERAVLFHCFAGCTAEAIMAALRSGKILAPVGHDPGQRQDGGGDLNKVALAVWRHAEPFPGTLADRYLRSRAIVPESVVARYDPRCQCGSGAAKAYAPALIVPIEDDTGVIAIHRTWLSPDGRGKADMPEPKRMLGNPGTGAVRWGGIPVDGILRLAEGVEDAASVMNMLGAGHSVWPVLGIERYQAVTVPESVHTVVIYSQHGSEAARAIDRAASHLTANGRQLVVKPPPHAGDWNDLLREIRAI
nr:toprim domain-containing protein [Sphingomonas carotinifaciens]